MVLTCPLMTSSHPSPPVDGPSTRRFWIILGLIMCVAMGVRLVNLAVTQWDQTPTGDARFYHESARLLADGHGYIDPFRYLEGYPDRTERIEFEHFGIPITVEVPPGIEQPTMSHPPLWPMLLAGAQWVGLETPNQQRLLGTFIGVLGVGLIGVAGRRLFGAQVGLIAAGLAAVYGFLVLNDASLMSESLVVVFVPIATIVAVRWWRSPSWGLAALLGLLTGLGGLLRPELIMYAPFVLISASLVHRDRWRRLLAETAIAAVVAGLVLSPWVVRNLTVFEKPMTLSQTGTTLAQTNCDATYFGDKLGYWELFCGGVVPAVSTEDIPDESVRDVQRRQQAIDYARSHPMRLVTVAVPVRILRMFNLFGPIQTAKYDVVVEGRSLGASVFSLVEYYLVAVAAVIGVVIARRRRLDLSVVLAWPALVAIVAALGFGNNRYRVTCEPALLWLAGLAIYAAFGRILAAKRSRVSATTQNTAISVSS